MNQPAREPSAGSRDPASSTNAESFVLGFHGVRYQVKDVSRSAEFYTRAGLRFRNEMETGPAGRQIQLEDPDGNPVELFEPAH